MVCKCTMVSRSYHTLQQNLFFFFLLQTIENESPKLGRILDKAK